MADPKDLIDVALSRRPADHVIRNVRILNVFTGDLEDEADIGLAGDTVAGIGRYHSAAGETDGRGLIAVPGFIDGHIHLESSLLTPDQFASVVVPRGTAAVVCDPHEIANVAGLPGLRYIVEAGRPLPLDVLITAPSCVPATRLETSGAEMGVEEITEVLGWPECVGLGEMMNFPGLLAGASDVLAKLSAAAGKHVDGHAPGMGGAALNAYIASGPSTDHESTTLEEGREKLARGLTLMIREGSSERNLAALAPLVTEYTFRRCILVSDDRAALDLRDQGHLDHTLRRAMEEGIPPMQAITMATLNTAQVFGLKRRGAIAPGFLADIVLMSDLSKIDVRSVFHRGREVARDNQLLEAPSAATRGPRDTVKLAQLEAGDIRIPAGKGRLPAIEIIPDQIVTKAIEVEPALEGSNPVPDPSRDLLKLVVAERHRGTGRISSCLVKGFGFKSGAIASSVAHDSHNLIAAGANDRDILTAMKAVASAGGGLSYAASGEVRALLPLPVAGLLSDRPLDEVCKALSDLRARVSDAGGTLEAPFATLSFLALPVIPEIRLTDFGLVDVMKQEVIL